jgi:hypothetical protein
MLVLYMYCGSISFSSCCNGRQGILQISFNLIMASLGSRQTVFSSSFVFIFIFFFSKKNKKTQWKREIDDFHRPDQFYTFTYRLNKVFHRHWSLIEHTYHNRKKKGVQPSIPGSSCRDRMGYTLVELITNTHTYKRCTLSISTNIGSPLYLYTIHRSDNQFNTWAFILCPFETLKRVGGVILGYYWMGGLICYQREERYTYSCDT